jgi:hypothetical protein
MSKQPPRLHVFLARDAPVAAVLRRGPSEWARLSLWHTDTDAVEHGQWLRARVYASRCDLSPDGSLFCYFVHKGSGGPDIDVDSWAAVSRPPWFTALALWKAGTTYFAGGYFPDDRSLMIGYTLASPDIGTLPAWLGRVNEPPYIDRTPDWTSRTVMVNRLLRDGWSPSTTAGDPGASWERVQPRGRDVLVQAPGSAADLSTYGGRDVFHYTRRSPTGEFPLGVATWCDWDHGGRLVIARDGRLCGLSVDGEQTLIEDFNGQAPDPQPSPPQASRWPDR